MEQTQLHACSTQAFLPSNRLRCRHIAVERRQVPRKLRSPAGQAYRRSCKTAPCRAMLAGSSEAMVGLLTTEEDFNEAITQQKVVAVDYMAKWCRKCIYLKPKLQKLFEEEFPQVPLVFVDVNSVPSKIIQSNGIRKMPTIAVYRDGKKVGEHVASETGTGSFQKVREIVQLAVMA